MKAIYAGTFDPVHNGHVDLINRAAHLFDELIVAVYDHGQPSKSILFTIEERVSMIEDVCGHLENIEVMPFGGLLVKFAEKIGSQVVVRGLRVFSDFEFEFRMALANKRLSPGIETVTFMAREEHTFLSGTTVREIASLGGDVSSMVPTLVAEALYARFSGKNDFDAIRLRD